MDFVLAGKVRRNRASVHYQEVYSVHCNLESPGTQSSYPPLRCQNKGLKGIVVNRKCLPLVGWSVEITLTVPLNLISSEHQSSQFHVRFLKGVFYFNNYPPPRTLEKYVNIPNSGGKIFPKKGGGGF